MYRREIDDQVLTLGASGWTYRSTFVLFDRETESLWFGGVNDLGTAELVCVGGFYQDRTLPLHPHDRALWPTWLFDHPESCLMVAN